jgi:hypothetical protein
VKEAKDWEEKQAKWMQKEEELEELVAVKGEVGEWKKKAEKGATEIEKLVCPPSTKGSVCTFRFSIGG